MDSYGTRVATGSKDATVAIASLRPTGLVPDRVLGDPGGNEMFHTRVIKGVSLRDETTVREKGESASPTILPTVLPMSDGKTAPPKRRPGSV